MAHLSRLSPLGYHHAGTTSKLLSVTQVVLELTVAMMEEN